MQVNKIEIKNVVKIYELGKTTVKALSDINLNIYEGDFLSIAGPSGSGKSTLLNLIGCLDNPTKGEIWFEKTETSKLKEKELDKIRLNKIGFIFQSFNLVQVLNVYENIELPLLIKKEVSAKERKARVMHFIAAVGLESHLHHKTMELSGGQRQRVAIARALVTKPEIVLADEPTANLDSKTGIEIIDLMKRINENEKTIFLFSTHDNKIIERAHRVIHIQDGMIIKE